MSLPKPLSPSRIFSILGVNAALLGLGLLGATTAFAAEVEFEGFYQTRGRFYDSLSLTGDATLGVPEGSTLYAEHRLWLRPRFLLSDGVRLTVDFKGLDNVVWGDRPEVPESFTGQPTFEEGLSAPLADADATSVLRDFTVWRAWGDIDTRFGRLSFGRMPLHWGAGMWQNDGLSLNAERGDTADRVQFEGLVQETVFVRAAFDTHAENFLNERDDTYALSLAAAYKSERVVGGLQVHYRRTDRLEPSNPLNLLTVDGALEADIGRLGVSAEGIGQFGGGDLNDGQNDVNITAFGAVLDAKLDLNLWQIRLQGGFASGDKVVDNKYRTFTFDRDYNVGIVLFEQPMPVFATASPNAINANRDFEEAFVEAAVSNALYVKPTLSRTIVDGLHGEVSVLGARVAAVPEAFANAGRRSYGTEVMGGVVYDGLQHFEVDARGGVFLPGSYFRNFTAEGFDGFDRPVVGVQLTSRVRF